VVLDRRPRRVRALHCLIPSSLSDPGIPKRETYRVQELHLALYHQLRLMGEARFFG